MVFLIRLAESGREAQPVRGNLKRDVVTEVRAVSSPCTVLTDAGRVFVETPVDVTEALREIHGIRSLSPCHRCRFDELESEALRLAESALVEASSYRVRVRWVGDHDESSSAVAARIGAVICKRYPNVAVSMREPDVVIGIEIRGEDCYLYDSVLSGADRRTERASLTRTSLDFS